MSRLLDRFFGVFSKIRPGEGVAVGILLLDLFLILTAYYLLKVVREPLILAANGAEVKSYASAGQAVLLIALVPAYGLIASRVPRMTLVNGVMMVFVGSFIVFWALYRAGVPIGIPFFLWLGIFNMMVIAQFWSLANELFSPAQGKRLFAVIAFGGTTGAIAGSALAKQLVQVMSLGVIMLIASGLLLACVGLTIAGAVAVRRGPAGEDEEDGFRESEGQDRPLEKKGGFRLVLSVRYLRLMALMIIVYNIVNTTGEFILGKVVSDTAAIEAGGNEDLEKQLIGEFYGDFFTWVNIVAAVLQALVVSRIVRYLGIRVGLLILPILALGGYTMLAIIPILGLIKLAKVAENGVDYSLHNTLRQTLWLPTSPEAKFKAKAAIDTFFVRFGDVLSAGVVWIGSAIALSPQAFAAVNVGMVVIWVVLAFVVGREHDRQPRKHTRDTGGSDGGLPEAIALGGKHGRPGA